MESAIFCTQTQPAFFDAVVSCLLDWAEWMKAYRPQTGYPRKSAMLQSGYVSATFDDMCVSADAYRNKVIDACVDALPIDQRSAIYWQYLSSRFLPRELEEPLAEGHDALAVSLRRKGVIW